jgi:hypothetical protein
MSDSFRPSALSSLLDRVLSPSGSEDAVITASSGGDRGGTSTTRMVTSARMMASALQDDGMMSGLVEDVRNPVMSTSISTSMSTSGRFPTSSVLFVDTDTVDVDAADTGMFTEGRKSEQVMSTHSQSTFASVEEVMDAGRYGIFVFPASQQEMQEICCKKVGYGATMCVKKNCFIKHKGDKINNKNGFIVVAISNEIVFLDSSTHHTNVTTELIEQWMSDKKTLGEWNDLFALANATEHHEILSVETVGPAQTFLSFARSYKSPGKFDRSFGEEGSNTEFTNIVTSKVIMNSGNEDIGTTPSGVMDPNESLELLVNKVGVHQEIMMEIVEKLDDKSLKTQEELQVLMCRSESIETEVGIRIRPVNEKFSMPTIWGSIAMLAGFMDDTHQAMEKLQHEEYLKNDLKREIKKIEETASATVQSMILMMDTKIGAERRSNFEAQRNHHHIYDGKLSDIVGRLDGADFSIYKLAQGASVLKDELVDVRKTSQGGIKIDENECVQFSMQELLDYKRESQSILADLKNRMVKLETEADGESIRFFGLGFKDRKDSEGWAQNHLQDCVFGTIVDVHLVMEHIHNAASDTEGTLKQLQSVYKLKFENLTQGLAVTSFDSRIPKYFSKTSNLVTSIRKSNVSHFDMIPSYAVWDEPQSGARDRLKEELLVFEEAHQELIEQTLDPESKAYNMAKQALNNSVSWIIQLVGYMEDTYKDLIRQNTFTVEKAWQLVTQLARRIFLEVSRPRIGVNTTFKVGDNEQIGRLILWPVLKCQDIMKRYKDAGFKDDPTIASEYVKFLAANSGTDAVEKVAGQMTAL